MDLTDRRRLAAALRERYQWVTDTRFGPSAVEAGECDGCGQEARLVATCGPGAVYLGRRCALAGGADVWCAGHADDAVACGAWLCELPAEADLVARLWWVATGEVRIDPALVANLWAQLPGQTGDVTIEVAQ